MFDGQLGYLDYALAGTALADDVTGAGAWHINADEPSLIDYDMTFKQPARRTRCGRPTPTARATTTR